MEERIATYRESLDALLTAPRLPFDSALRTALPVQSGLYRISEAQSDWRSSVYVGESDDLRRRVGVNHFGGNRKASTLVKKLIQKGLCRDEAGVKRFLSGRCVVQYLLIPDKTERAFAQHFAIALLRPTHND